ncbi:MAG: glycosyltransferase [Verrucomicrobiota bacterium]|nr:glycosyltransferase [Verrucomicrobiota bacterium]
MNIVVLGLSITSSWGNGHATTYRGLIRELSARGHQVLFLERDVPWYAENRDMPRPPFCRTILYSSLEDLRAQHSLAVRNADVVILGSYVPEGIAVGEWVTSIAEGHTLFYDIDTPVTLARLARKECEYINPALIGKFDLYLSFTGGPTLRFIEEQYDSPMARALYCSVDPTLYYPEPTDRLWDLGYLGTYSDDRQPAVERLLNQPARRLPENKFVVAGPQYPDSLNWPRNVQRITHVSPASHRKFYNAQRFTLNVTRADMIAAGFSPSVRLFEAMACGVPVISDYWQGLDTLFRPSEEILIASSGAEIVEILTSFPEETRKKICDQGRRKVLAEHTAQHRAMELERYIEELRFAQIV